MDYDTEGQRESSYVTSKMQIVLGCVIFFPRLAHVVNQGVRGGGEAHLCYMKQPEGFAVKGKKELVAS